MLRLLHLLDNGQHRLRVGGIVSVGTHARRHDDKRLFSARLNKSLAIPEEL